MKRILDFWKKNIGLIVAQLLFAVLAVVIVFKTQRYTYRKLFYTNEILPTILKVAAFVPLIISVGVLFCKKKWLLVCSMSLSILSIVAVFLLIALCVSKLTYFFMAGAPYFISAGLVLVVVYLFSIDRLKIRTKKAVAWVTLSVVVLTIVMGIFNLRPFVFDTDAVVFAVEDEYQICWITSTQSVGYVKVGEEVYTDSTAGSYNVSRTHKVIVPRQVLEEKKEYTVCSKNILKNRAYLTVSTSEINRKYTFRPVDFSDGLQIYNISDNHLFIPGAIKAGDYFKEDLDILIANGDHLNDVSEVWQFVNMYTLLSSVTKSARPVIITRGNHEAIGSMLSELPNLIGSYEGNLYYKVRFGDVMFVVFDTTNDMKDDNNVIKNTANFAECREKEIEWFRSEIDKGSFSDPSIEMIIGVCHMALPVRGHHKDFINEMVPMTEEIGMDLMISGHYHNLNYYQPETKANPSSYPVVFGSIRSDDNAFRESISFNAFTGTAIEIKDDVVTVRFTNSKGEVKGEFVLE